MSASEDKTTRFLATFLALAALALLLFAYLLVAICLFHAARDGILSDLWAPPSGGNHGPWRHYALARTHLDSSPLFVVPAISLACFSLSLGRKRLPTLVLLGCAAFILNFALFLWMLTD